MNRAPLFTAEPASSAHLEPQPARGVMYERVYRRVLRLSRFLEVIIGDITLLV